MTNPKNVSESDKLKLLELQERELILEQEKRRRDKEREATPEHVITIESKHRAFVAASPFREFVRNAFAVIEPSRQFRYNWHLSIICELMQATILGYVRNFIINQPRRTMKSLLTCVFFPAWVWTFLPHLRFLFTSYSKDFAARDNDKTKDLINSDWYQSRYGHLFSLITQRRDKLRNNKGGFRVIFRIGKGVGEGGDFVIADDPNDIEEVESDAQLKRTNQGYSEISSQNVADRQTAVRGINQQRTHPNDLTGYILEDEKLKKLFTSVLCLANRFEDDNENANTPNNPLYLGKVTEFDKAANPKLIVGEDKMWIDPRCLEAPTYDNLWYREWYEAEFASQGLTSRGNGQLLWEDYIGEEETEDAESLLGEYGTSAQMQQQPIQRGGNFFNVEYFPTIPLEKINLNNLVYIRYWDKAGSQGKGDWTVGTLVARTRQRPYKFYIIDQVRCQLSYFERMELIKRIAKEDYQNYVESKTNTEYTIGIEREGGSSGKDISLIEAEELIGFNVWVDFKQTSKESRAKIVRQRSESGYIIMAKNPVWNKIFLKRLQKYKPDNKHNKDDEIDTGGGAIFYLAFILLQQEGSTADNG